MKPVWRIVTKGNSCCYPLLSAALLIIALPWIGFGYVILASLVPLFLFLSDKRVSERKAYTLSIIAILIYMLFAIFPLMQVEGSWWTGTHGLNKVVSEDIQYVFLLILAACWHTLAFIPILPLVRKFLSHAWGVPLIALAWVLLEWAFTNFGLWGYSIGILGYSLVDTAFIKDIALFSGVYGLSFVAVYVNAMIVFVIHKYQKSLTGYSWNKELPLVILIAVLFAVPIFVPHNKLKGGEGKTFHVALIGSSLSTEESITSAGYSSYREQIISALSRDPDIVLLPENAFPYFELNEEDGTLVRNSLINFSGRDALYQDLLTLSREHGSTTIAIGLHTYRAGKHYNSLVFYKAGSVTAYYEKRVLVPFTEYAPFGLSIPMYVRLSPGASFQPIEAGGASWNALICSEIGDTNIALTKGEPILVSSNDSIFTGRAAALMHQQMAKVRAIENDAYVLRATKGGITSVIDPYGKVLASTKEGIVFAEIPLPYASSR